MTLEQFMKRYPDESSCKSAWRKIREREGIVCPVCGGITYYWKADKECFECKSCQHRQSLRAGTVMHNSHLPFRYWFIAMFLLTMTKNTFSASEVQRQIGHKNYVPIWTLLHKLRSIMGLRDTAYQLVGHAEVDDAFYTTGSKDIDKDNLNRGRGSQRMTKVLVMAQTEKPSLDTTSAKAHSKPTALKFIKMNVIPDLKSATIDNVMTKAVDPSSAITSDKSTSYGNFKNMFNSHSSQVISPSDIGKVLPWVHIAISNSKRMISNVYHNVHSEYLQYYLNEFCYKQNRRYFGNNLFDRLLLAAVSLRNTFRYQSA